MMTNLTQNVTGKSDWYETFLIFQGIVIITLIVLTEMGNILTIVAVAKFKTLRKQNFIFIPSLAAADALAGLGVGINVLSAMESIWCTDALGSTLAIMAPVFGLFLSHLHILVMTLDRLFAIAFPFRYAVWVTVERLRIAIIGMWLCGLMYALSYLSWGWKDVVRPLESCGLYHVPQEYISWSMAPVLILTVITLIVTYVKIFRVAKRKSHVITVEPMPGNNTSGKPQGDGSDQPNSRSESGKISKYIAGVIGAHIITWTMFFCVRIAGIFRSEMYTQEGWSVIEYIALDIGFINSALNVLIYACFLSEFRKAYKRLICCCCVGNRPG